MLTAMFAFFEVFLAVINVHHKSFAAFFTRSLLNVIIYSVGDGIDGSVDSNRTTDTADDTANETTNKRSDARQNCSPDRRTGRGSTDASAPTTGNGSSSRDSIAGGSVFGVVID
uniref:Secreted protein n=1 Tax=Panagrellus redivivus TaxID=6233 RepID=A0A7E4ZYQ3_PANRE